MGGKSHEEQQAEFEARVAEQTRIAAEKAQAAEAAEKIANEGN